MASRSPKPRLHLSPTQQRQRLAYLLVCLAEEAGEVAKEALKALRFGTEGTWEGKTTLDRLNMELADLDTIVGLITPLSDFRVGVLNNAALRRAKTEKLERVMADSRAGGLVKPE